MNERPEHSRAGFRFVCLIAFVLVSGESAIAGGTDTHEIKPLYSIMGDRTGDHFGVSVAACGDLNDDCVPDFIVGADRLSTGWVFCGLPTRPEGPGYVEAICGATGATIWTARAEDATVTFGHEVCATPDLDGDRLADVLVVANTCSGCSGGGFIRVVSGIDGRLIRQFPAAGDERDSWYTGCGVGDVNGNGVGDFLLANAWGRPSGTARVFDGLTGAAIHRVEDRDVGRNDYFGIGVGSIGDVDGDGLADFVIQESSHEEESTLWVRVLSGYSGEEIYAIAARERATSLRIPDRGWDGIDDLAVCELDVLTFRSGYDGTVEVRVDLELEGWVAGLAGDLDRDGREDVLVCLKPPQGWNKWRVYSTWDGRELARIGEKVLDSGCQTLVRGGDFDGDGVGEWIAAYPDEGNGWVRVFSGRELSRLR